MLRRVGWTALACLACAPGQAAWACAPLDGALAAQLPLNLALSRVGDCHPAVRAARAALAGVVADVQTAGQRPNPQLTVGANSVGRSLGSGNLWNKTFDHAVRVDQLVERGGKPALRVAAAEAGRVAARADVGDALRQAAQAVSHLHLDLWAAQQRQVQLKAAAALSAEALTALDRRVAAGDAPALDATKFRLDDLRVQSDLRLAAADIRGLQLQLAQLIGADALADQLQAVLDATAAFEVPAASQLERRADVRAALARVEAAERQRDLVAATRTRDLGVGLQFDRYPTGPGNSSGSGNTVSVSVSVPLFVRHANEGELARAEADLAQARDALQRTRETAQLELARAQVQALAAAEHQQLVASQLEPAAERVAAGAELAYRRGASSALEVLDARRNLRNVRIERITAEAELAKARADWRTAAGTLAAEPTPP